MPAERERAHAQIFGAPGNEAGIPDQAKIARDCRLCGRSRRLLRHAVIQFEFFNPLADQPLAQSRAAFMRAQIAARLQFRAQLPQPDGEIVERHKGVRRLRCDPRQPLQRAADKAARPAVAPAQHAACPYRHAKSCLPGMRELPGDIAMRSVIERRHDPHQPGYRQLRIGHIEKRRQRGLDQLDRDAAVPDTLRQTPADIVENSRPGPIGEVQADVLPQFPEQRQCPRHRDARGPEGEIPCDRLG